MNDLEKLLPSSINQDKKIKDISKIIDISFDEIIKIIDLCLLYHRIDTMDEALLNELAWQFNVDFYDPTFSLEQKRNAVKKSIIWHKHKGTVGALEDYVSTIFGNARVIEWFDYDGEPYHFKIDMITGEIPSIEALNKIVKAIYMIKNTRSWCDGLGFLRTIDNKIYIGSHQSQFKHYKINLNRLGNSSLKTSIYLGTHINQFKKINIDVAKYLENTTFRQSIFIKPYINIFKKYTINTNTINAIHIMQDLSFVSNINSFKQYKLKLSYIKNIQQNTKIKTKVAISEFKKLDIATSIEE